MHAFQLLLLELFKRYLRVQYSVLSVLVRTVTAQRTAQPRFNALHGSIRGWEVCESWPYGPRLVHYSFYCCHSQFWRWEEKLVLNDSLYTFSVGTNCSLFAMLTLC